MQQDPNQDNQRSNDASRSLFDDTSNVGGPIGPGVDPQEERTWSMLSHLSILLWLITGPVSFFLALTLVLLPVAPLVLVAPPLIIWFVYKDKSPRIRFHAAQSFWYQTLWVIGSVLLSLVFFVIGGILTVLTLGLALVLLVPLGLVIGLIPFVHQCYAAYKVNGGVEYRLLLVADLVDGGRRFS